jgi:arylsulfatase A-like enzyme
MRFQPAPILLAVLLGCSRPPPRPPPNIVLISVDTLRSDALRADDRDAPPLVNLDAFAAQSVRFRHAVSAASWTLPSHGSLFTGLYPRRHGATDPRVKIATRVQTLTQALQARGYQTLGFANGGFLARIYGFDRGFERYESRGSSPTDPLDSTFDRAAAAISKRHDRRPLFLFVHTYSVHDYFRLHPWAVRQLATPPARTARAYQKCLKGTLRCQPQDWQTLRALYRAEVRNLDGGFGRLRAELEAKGLWANSIVVFTADHGEGFDPARRRIHHGGRLDEDVLRVPLWVHGPRFAAHDVGVPVSLVDVMPTLLALADAPVPPDLDGRSFAGALRGEPGVPAPRPLYASEYCYGWWGGSRIRSSRVESMPHALAVIDGDRWFLWSPGREELYDLATDHNEEHDLLASSDPTALLHLALAHRAARVVTPKVQRVQPRLRAQLEALGYADEATQPPSPGSPDEPMDPEPPRTHAAADGNP